MSKKRKKKGKKRKKNQHKNQSNIRSSASFGTIKSGHPVPQDMPDWFVLPSHPAVCASMKKEEGKIIAVIQ